MCAKQEQLWLRLRLRLRLGFSGAAFPRWRSIRVHWRGWRRRWAIAIGCASCHAIVKIELSHGVAYFWSPWRRQRCHSQWNVADVLYPARYQLALSLFPSQLQSANVLTLSLPVTGNARCSHQGISTLTPSYISDFPAIAISVSISVAGANEIKWRLVVCSLPDYSKK